MAVRTFRRSLPVNDHLFFPYEPGLRVTFIASHFSVPALQREVRSRVVIERRRHPSLRGMAIRAWRLAGFCKLPCVDVFVTIFANLRSALELHLSRTDRYLVARPASHRAMRTK